MTLPLKTLYLVPAPLSQELPAIDLSAIDLKTVSALRRWLVETPKQARAFLKLYAHPGPLAELQIAALSEFGNRQALDVWLQSSDEAVGVMSDAGCPGVADPGALAVESAHACGWAVSPMVGASSILLALMGSGMNGQSFTFHGYLPVDAAQRSRVLRETEQASARLSQTQIAIETPYRNASLLTAMLDVLRPDTQVCLASELRGPRQRIERRSVAQWRSAPPDLGKQATLFVWQAQSLGQSVGQSLSTPFGGQGTSVVNEASSNRSVHRSRSRRS